jgi:hypothetical protein
MESTYIEKYVNQGLTVSFTTWDFKHVLEYTTAICCMLSILITNELHSWEKKNLAFYN